MAQKWPFIARKGDGSFIPLQGSASKGAVGFIARYEHPNYGPQAHRDGTTITRTGMNDRPHRLSWVLVDSRPRKTRT